MLAVLPMTMHGHIKISRKAFTDDELWLERREYSRWEAWVDLIQMAAWKPYKRVVARHEEWIGRGELCVSRRFLAKRWRWGEKRVRVFLETALNVARLRAQRETPVGTVYLIVNYDRYQSANQVSAVAEGPGEGPLGAQGGPKEEADKAVKAVKASPRARRSEGRKYPHFPDTARVELHRLWSAHRVEDMGRFIRAFAPLFSSETPRWTVAEVAAGIEEAFDQAECEGAIALRMLTPEKFVQQAPQYIAAKQAPLIDEEGNPTTRFFELNERYERLAKRGAA